MNLKTNVYLSNYVNYSNLLIYKYGKCYLWKKIIKNKCIIYPHIFNL